MSLYPFYGADRLCSVNKKMAKRAETNDSKEIPMKKAILSLVTAAAFLFVAQYTPDAEAGHYCRACYFTSLKKCGGTPGKWSTAKVRMCTHFKMMSCANKRWFDTIDKCYRVPPKKWGQIDNGCKKSCQKKLGNKATWDKARKCINHCWHNYAVSCAQKRYKKKCGN